MRDMMRQYFFPVATPKSLWQKTKNGKVTAVNQQHMHRPACAENLLISKIVHH